VGPTSGFLNTQIDAGASESWAGIVSGAIDRGDGVPLALSFTPSVDAWWEVGVLAYGQRIGTGDSHPLVRQTVSPVPPFGGFRAHARVSLNPNVIRMHWAFSRIYPLSAGVAYTVLVEFAGAISGAAEYYRGPDYLNLSAKAWMR
jgi:hypothetical protein